MKNNSHNRKVRVSGTQQNRMRTHPPQVNGMELRHSATLRFRVPAAISSTISFQNLLDTMLVATTAVAGTNLFQTVRIREVRIWGIGAVGTSTSASLEFSGTTTGVLGDQAIHTDTSVGVSPLFIRASPSRRALASDFQLSTGAAAFVLTVPAGSVVDVDLTFRSAFASANASCANALVGATAGAQYVRGLDGLAVATTAYPPEYTVGTI
jgi:hypothetical protein